MKIAPIEIRQKTFDRTWRGYNEDDVSAFLMTLSRKWEQMQDEIKDLHTKLAGATRDIAKLRNIETSLYKTLKTAENASANIIEHAKKKSELLLEEAKMEAENLLKKTQYQARETINSSNILSQQTLDEMELQLKELIENYQTVETTRTDLMDELKHIVYDIDEKMNRMKANKVHFDSAQYLATVQQKRKENLDTNVVFQNNVEDSSASSITPSRPQENQNSNKSFFDEIP